MSKFLVAAVAVVVLAVVAVVVAGAPTFSRAPSVEGRWDAVVTVKNLQVPFRLDIRPAADGVQGVFYDGDRAANPSTRGSFEDGLLHLAFDSHAAALDARYEDGVLRGTYGDYPFEARPHRAAKTAAGPDIAGIWEIPTESPKGEKAWRLVVRQEKGETFASILRIDGDTGTLNGAFKDGRFRLSRFAGERPGVLELAPRPDGSLEVVHFTGGGRHDYVAVREQVARSEGRPPPSDPSRFTTVSNPSERFRFAGAELASGEVIDHDDPRFRGKVVLVNVMGSWCPNCHDEAPFLAELYDKYRARGLEIVALDFEQAEQLKSLTRLKAFVARYGLDYTVLVAGEPKEAKEKLPQVVGLNAWPTSFILGRDGKVRNVHVGFPSRGSGPFEVQARAAISQEIEALLAERAPGVTLAALER